MKASSLILTLLVPFTALCAGDRTSTDTQKDLLITNLTETLNASAQANFYTACLSVTRDVKRKHLTIYALDAAAKSQVVKVHGYKIETVYHPDLAACRFKRTVGTFFAHNNHLVLTFAASEFAAGRRALALEVVKRLVEVDLEMTWYSHEGHGRLPVAKILSGLESGGGDLKAFLHEEAADWKWTAETYGPKSFNSMHTNRRQQMRNEELHFVDTGFATGVDTRWRSVIVFRYG